MNSPKEVANNYIAIGKGKVNTPVAKMFVLGILAGIFIALHYKSHKGKIIQKYIYMIRYKKVVFSVILLISDQECLF